MTPNTPLAIALIEALTRGVSTHEVAYTKPDHPYPAYINVGAVGGGGVQITVRSDPEPIVMGDDDSGGPGPTARIHLGPEAWKQLLFGLARLAWPIEEGPTAGAGYPTYRDPLMQRTDPSLPDDHPDNRGYYERNLEPNADFDTRGVPAAHDVAGHFSGYADAHIGSELGDLPAAYPGD